MKITKIDVFQESNPENPIWKPVLCRIYTDEGIYGDGEAAMAYGIASGGAFGMVQDLAKLILGMDPLDNDVIWQKMYRQTFWGQNGGSVFTAGMSAIDLALWDIKGKYFKVPVYKLLGGKMNDNLRTYASQLQFGWQPAMLAMRSLKEYQESAKKAVSEGYDCVKIDFFMYKEKPSDGGFSESERTTLLPPERLDLIVSRVAAVREAIGPKVDLIVENHSLPDAQSAIQIGKAIEKYNIFYFEEPNTPDPDTAKYISSKLDIPIASGERIYTRWQYAKYFKDASLQVIQPDLGTSGGITEVKKICDMAYTYDVSVQIHACGSPLSTAASLQIEAAIPNFIIHEHHIVNLCDFNKKLCKYDYQPVNGRFKVPELPGLGNELSDYVLNKTRKVTIEGNLSAWSM
ncbi:MAG: mandelate racemase/muconate lactonizing enzyme family protein [Treponemataceae bacterium]